MKIAKLALISAILLGSWSRLSATEPTLNYFSYGWFGTSGYYPIEYFVDVDDSDGDLNELTVSAHYESSNNWQTQETLTGDGFHLRAHGYGDTIDGATEGIINYADGEASYHEAVEFSF